MVSSASIRKHGNLKEKTDTYILNYPEFSVFSFDLQFLALLPCCAKVKRECKKKKNEDKN